MKNKNEVVMLNDETGAETEVHANSVEAMKAAGWSLKKGEKVPELPKTETGNSGGPTIVVNSRTPEEQAQRDAEDEGAKAASASQLKTALTELNIEFPANAKKPALLALYLARP